LSIALPAAGSIPPAPDGIAIFTCVILASKRGEVKWKFCGRTGIRKRFQRKDAKAPSRKAASLSLEAAQKAQKRKSERRNQKDVYASIFSDRKKALKSEGPGCPRNMEIEREDAARPAATKKSSTTEYAEYTDKQL
jgi:hypothetical protein